MMSKYSVVRATIGEAKKQQAMTVLTAMCSAFHAVFTSQYYPLVVVMKIPGQPIETRIVPSDLSVPFTLSVVTADLISVSR